MKKQALVLIMVALTAILLIAVVLMLPGLLSEEGSGTSSAGTNIIEVVNKTKDEHGKIVDKPIKKVAINNSVEFEISENEEMQLAVKGFEDLPANVGQINFLTSNLARLTATRKVADDSSNASDFGLDAPRETAVVTYHDYTTIKFELGNDAAGGLGAYLRVQENGPIYLVSSRIAGYLLDPPEAYVGTAMITPPQAKTDGGSSGSDQNNDTAVLINIRLAGSIRKDSPLAISINESIDKKDWFSGYSYVVTSPFKKGARDDFADMAKSLVSLYAIQVVKAHPGTEQLKEYGLDTPYSVAELTLAVQSQRTGEDGNTAAVFYNSKKHIVKLGKKDSGGNYYAMVEGLNAVFLVSAGSVPWAELKYSNVVSEQPFPRDVQSVKAVEIEIGDIAAKFDLTHYPEEKDRSKNMAVDIGGKKYSAEQFRKFYQVITGIERLGESDRHPGGKPDAVIRMILVDGSGASSAYFYKVSTSTYLCVMSDGDRFTVKSSSIDQLINALENCLRGEDIGDIYD